MKNEKYIFFSAIVPYDRVYSRKEYYAEIQSQLDHKLQEFIKETKPTDYRIINATVVNLPFVTKESGEPPMSSTVEHTIHIAYW